MKSEDYIFKRKFWRKFRLASVITKVNTVCQWLVKNSELIKHVVNSYLVFIVLNYLMVCEENCAKCFFEERPGNTYSYTETLVPVLLL
jgi:2-iminoacetate synthase ThiH